jgi:hypothetical protein
MKNLLIKNVTKNGICDYILTRNGEMGNKKHLVPGSKESTKTSGNHCKQVSTLQMHCAENSKQIFSELKLGGLPSLISTFGERFIYSHDRSANAIQQNRRTE